ncbi:hypothetical protein BH11MYX3_BH11MYX3_07850 [soil metagenome]
MLVNTTLVRIVIAGLLAAGCQSRSGDTAADKGSAAPTTIPPVASPAITPLYVASSGAMSREAAPPWTLTASDGSGLQITRIDAKAVVQGPLAFTELHLYFHNPEQRTREGAFAITLPPGAAVSRFAMETEGRMQEAEVVEKAVALRVYDDYLHRRQDPALLEKGAGNQFTAKVFPIPAMGDKHVVVSFSQELAGQEYTLPLRGLPKVERVDVKLGTLQVDGTSKDQVLDQRNWRPDRDFVAVVPISATAVTAGTLVAGSIAFADKPDELGAPQPLKRLTLLVDTSASRALGFEAYVTEIHALIDRLRAQYGDQLALQVIAFDQDTQRIFDGSASNYGGAQDSALLARGAAGASNLGQAFAALRSGTAPHERLVLVTDGVVTAGPDTPALLAAVQQVAVQRLDVVLVGGIRDERLAGSLARAGLPVPGDVFDLDRGTDAVAKGLGEPVLINVAIEIPGASWVYPKQLPAARPGSSQMVYARMDKPVQSIDVVIAGKHRTVQLGPATPALIERAVAGAEIEDLENQLEAATADEAQKALREDIAKRSVKARVISSQTSMLVLESEVDYERYKIPRSALANILVIGPTGIELVKRGAIVVPTNPPQEPQNGILDGVSPEALNGVGDISSGFDDSNIYGGLLGNDASETTGSFGLGRTGFGPGGGGSGWGTIGTGRYGTIGHGSGSGSGYGVGGGRGGMRGRVASVPTVSVGQPSSQGDLDKAIIRRYIKRNIQKITYCYEKELLAKPRLQGKLDAKFFITPNGNVAMSQATGFDAGVSTCVAKVIKDIEFPKPKGGGGVQVIYPFTFRYSESSSADSRTSAPRNPGWGATQGEATPKRVEPTGPLTGKLATVMQALALGDQSNALDIARAWHAEAPGDVLSLIALGEVLEARHDKVQAARVYGSIIDLFSSRADLRRWAGERLERVGGRELAIDTYRRAVADRPDHVTGHRLLAYALVRSGDLAGAFAAILVGIDQQYPDGRFEGAERVLRDDAGMIAAAYLAHGGSRDEVLAALSKRSIVIAGGPSTRFIMYWETDSNDVDFHIKDAKGGHAWYQSKQLPSGGSLYADITTGYGPECFAIEGTPTAGPYELSINYFSQGPMGYGMGLLQVQRFDGKNFTFDDRPYVIMIDHAFVQLGKVP